MVLKFLSDALQVEGWLQVCDRDLELGHRASNRLKNVKPSLATWEPHFCVLRPKFSKFTQYRSEDMAGQYSLKYDSPVLRLDGSCKLVHKRWSYYDNTVAPPPLIEENEEDVFYNSPQEPYCSCESLRPFTGNACSFNQPERTKQHREHYINYRSNSCISYDTPEYGSHYLNPWDKNHCSARLEEDSISFGGYSPIDQMRNHDYSSIEETQSLRGDILHMSNTDTSYEKACGSDRRGSAPNTPILGSRPLPDPPASTANKFVNFFSKRSFKGNPLKRTKSVTKLERMKRNMSGIGNGSALLLEENSASALGTTNYGSQDVSFSRLKSSRSHESLLNSEQNQRQQMMHTLDVGAGEVTIKPLHPSILGQDHCFQITSPTGSRYYSCRNAEERDKWVDSLRKAINPHADQFMRTENSLKIFILEAKRITAKKKYFCELLLDGSLYGRTGSKSKGELCFWGEQFEFTSLPNVENITVNLYREAERRRKKEKNVLLGSVTIPVLEVTSVTSRCLHEKWYSVLSDSIKGLAKEQPSLRIKCRFQSVRVLPLQMYSELLQHLKENYWPLCSALEPNVNVKAKEDIGTTLVHIMHKERLAKDFLADLVMLEIDRIDDAHLLFRGNSLATKAMEAFMKLVGEKYLHETLRHVINKIVDEGLDCEVDRTKVTQNATLLKHQENLLKVVRMTWTRILNSCSFFPKELKDCFCKYRERLESSGKGHLSDNLISASIFLRFLCPAILSPSLFNITQEYPDERTSRNLTLIAKTLQTLANFTKFQGKENFMEFMNEFIEKEQEQMRVFLKRISTPQLYETYRGHVDYEGEIDLGVQLSILHTLLTDAVPKMELVPQNNNDIDMNSHLKKFRTILESIKDALQRPNINIVQKMSENDLMESEFPISQLERSPNKIGSCERLQSLQRNIFCYNDPTIKIASEENYPNPNLETTDNLGTTPDSTPKSTRSSTLPRASILQTSLRKAAADLSTTDDYVLFSALDSENVKSPKTPHSISHSKSHSHIPNSNQLKLPQSTNLFIQPNNVNVHHRHHHHFHNHAGWYSNVKVGLPTDHPSRKNVLNSQNKNQSIQESNDGTHEDANNFENETNMKGSQTSISQLSNVASSGYQSFAYSQSSSPVDPAISQADMANNNVNGSINNRPRHAFHSHQGAFNQGAPLAFNNPMYNNNTTITTSPKSVHRESSYPHKNFPQRIPPPIHQSPISSSVSSSHSIEDLSTQSTKAISRLTSTRGNSTSSDDSNSLTCSTPPVEQRLCYKSTAPRTNPRCVPHQTVGLNPFSNYFSPEHHHSTSDLLGPKCPRRNRQIKRQVFNPRRIGSESRRYDAESQGGYDSDTSSEGESVNSRFNSRSVVNRNQRNSETKTLDEYEKEILDLQSSMEQHLKLMTDQDLVKIPQKNPHYHKISHVTQKNLSSPKITSQGNQIFLNNQNNSLYTPQGQGNKINLNPLRNNITAAEIKNQASQNGISHSKSHNYINKFKNGLLNDYDNINIEPSTKITPRLNNYYSASSYRNKLTNNLKIDRNYIDRVIDNVDRNIDKVDRSRVIDKVDRNGVITNAVDTKDKNCIDKMDRSYIDNTDQNKIDINEIDKKNKNDIGKSETNNNAEGTQMRELLKTLITSHEELIKDQQKKSEILNKKDAVIEAQEERIAALNRSNAQLLLALSHIQNNRNNSDSLYKKIESELEQL